MSAVRSAVRRFVVVSSGASTGVGALPGSRLALRAGVGMRARDRGMATAEYAIATLAACGFATLLVVLLRSGEVRGLLFGIIRRALSAG